MDRNLPEPTFWMTQAELEGSFSKRHYVVISYMRRVEHNGKSVPSGCRHRASRSR